MATAVLDDTAAQLARRLDEGALFTRLAEEMSGEPVAARVDSRDLVGLNADERSLLVVPGGAWGMRRTGTLVTASGLQAARVLALVLTDRLEPEVVYELVTSDTPLGVLLEPFGVRRQQLRSWPGEGDSAMHVCARLWLPRDGDPDDEVPVALADEWVLQAWLEEITRQRVR